MAPNKKGGAQTDPSISIISKAEVEARGKGTLEDIDSYTPSFKSEKRVFFTGLMFLTRLPCPGCRCSLLVLSQLFSLKPPPYLIKLN
jgi:hypothetical protein